MICATTTFYISTILPVIPAFAHFLVRNTAIPACPNTINTLPPFVLLWTSTSLLIVKSVAVNSKAASTELNMKADRCLSRGKSAFALSWDMNIVVWALLRVSPEESPGSRMCPLTYSTVKMY